MFGRLLDVVLEGSHFAECFELRETAGFQLTDSLPREVHDDADFFERDPAAIRDVERAGLRKVPDCEGAEVELDRTGALVDVEIQVMFARDERAGALGVRSLQTLGTARRSLEIQVGIQLSTAL